MKSTGRPRFMGLRWSAALVLGGLIAGTALAGGAGAATASPATSVTQPGSSVRAATDESQLTVSVAPDNGGVIAAGQDLSVEVSVTNDGATAFVAGTVDLWLDETPIASRKALTDWLDSTADVPGVRTIGRATVGGLEPGSTSVARVTVPAASVPLASRTTQGVFGIGSTVSIGSGTRAEGRSTIVWNAGGEVQRSNISVVMPITSPATADGLISSADLATYTAPNGVLTRELDGLAGHPTVAVGLDPMIVASIRVLGTAAPATATEWLLELSRLPNDVFSLGYGDADLAGQFQAGLRAPLAPTSLVYALNPANFATQPTPVGEPSTNPPALDESTPTPTPTSPAGPVLPTLDELVAWPYTLQGVAWPAEDSVRGSDVASFVANGLTTTIVSGGNTNASDLSSTPSAVIPVSGGKVAASDAGISDALRDAATATSDTEWNQAMSRVNAQLGLVSEESAGTRNLVVTLGRSWPSSGTQLERTLRTILTSPWSNAITFPQALSSNATAGLTVKDLSESDSRITNIKRLLDAEDQLGDFATILDNPETMTGRARAQLLTLLAVSWTEPRNDWATAVTNSIQATFKTLDSVKILPTENVNLVSAQGSIPFTVSNGLPDEAANIVLNASPSNSRLEIDEDATKRIQADSRSTVLVPVKAKLGNGQVTLTLQLLSPTGVKIGLPTSVTVEVHADWEGIGALIIGALLVLLFGFGIVRNILRRRRENSQREQETEAGAETEAGTETEAGAETEDEAETTPEERRV